MSNGQRSGLDVLSGLFYSGGQSAGAADPEVTNFNGVGNDAFGTGDASADSKQVLVGYDATNQPILLDSSNAKDWYEAQFVQNTPIGESLRDQLAKLGYENDREMLYALSRGVDFAANPYSSVNEFGAGNAFEWIMAQPVGGSGSGSGAGGGPFTNVQTVRDISSPDEGMTVANTAYESQMGRRATMEEGAAFTQALNMMERQNPTKSVQSGTTSGRNTTSTSETTGGFSAARFAEDWVRSQEGYGETFAATSFMRLLDEAISRPDVVKQRMEEIA